MVSVVISAVKPSMKETKQLSVDDLLFMDEDLPQGQVHIPPQGHNVIHFQGQGQGQLATHFEEEQFVDLKSVREPTGIVTSVKEESACEAATKTKLTAPVTLHSRSRSNPVDTASAPSPSPIVHPRSRSKDYSDTISSPKTKSDPFAFVSDELANSRRVASPPNDVTGAMDTVSYNNNRSKLGTRGKMAESAAASAAKRLAGNQNQTDFAQNQNVNKDSHKHQQPLDSKGALNPLYELERMKGKDLSSKNCSQEAGKQLDATKDDDSSQDTYEMDMSSSPVY